MMESVNSTKFLEIFGDVAAKGFINPIILTDVRIGFSIQKSYPEGIRFKPAKNEFGVADNVAVIWVVCEEKRVSEDGLAPIRFRISMMSTYRAKNWDYDYSDKECPTRESVIQSSKTPKPMDLDLVGEYFYDQNRNILVDSGGNEVLGVAILEELFLEHCNSVHLIKGAKRRAKAYIDSLPVRILSAIIPIIAIILKKIFGRTLDESLDRSTYLDGYLPKNLKVTEDDFIELAGYRAAKRVIVIYAFIVALFCLFYLPTNPGTYLDELVGSDFLLIVHTILFLVILDVVIPQGLFRLLNSLIRIRKWFLNRQLSRVFR